MDKLRVPGDDLPTIVDHHDGHGLNESILISRDERDIDGGGGASHRYTAAMLPLGDGPLSASPVLDIQFQHGARDEEGSTAGVTDATLLAIVLDRYKAFQAGPFGCRENAIIITKLEESIHWMKHRADERARRNVLGHNKA